MKIVTHNAYWFQGMPSRWGKERPAPHDDILAGLAGLYRSLEVDVLCIQEAPDANTVTHLAGDLGMEGHLYGAGGILHAYGGAMLVRNGATLRNQTDGSGGPHERVCLEAHVRVCAGRLLRIVNLHLPSNRYDAVDVAAERRVSELSRLLDRDPRPDVIAGDMNSPPGEEVSHTLLAAGYVDAAELAQQGDRPTTRSRRIDYVWLAPDVAEGLASYEVIDDDRFCAPGGGLLSDHFPICVRLGADGVGGRWGLTLGADGA